MYDEKELIGECISGNRLAEKQLYEQYSARFFGICLRYAESREEAEELLVDGFIQIFKHLPDFRFQGSFEGWMKRIIIRQAIETLRHKHPLETVPISGLPLAEQPGSEPSLQRLEVQEIMQSVRKLPPVLRSIFNLYAVEGYTHREIARELQMKETTVRVYFQRARALLQKILTEKE